ncbi:hypothetical protein AB1Y20_013315 [Prymnesium parvum]|uniref:Auxin efflux carrier component n=1 Tax=Prymnesium parvum TaxID=97485 RepID=A0AB34INW7_PRYPA
MWREGLAVAAGCQAQFVLICGTGVLAARQRQLDAHTISQLSHFYLRFLMPCVVLQLNQVFTYGRTSAWSPVLLVAALHIALGAALGRGGAAALRLRPPLTQCLTMICAFGNCGSLPFVLVLPIVKSWSSTSADADAFGKGMGVIGLYLAAWFLVFFSCGTAYLSQIKPADPPSPPADGAADESVGRSLLAAAASPPPRCRQLCRGVRLDPILAHMTASVCLGSFEPARAALSDSGALAWLGTTVSSLGHAGVVLGTVILGGSLWEAHAATHRLSPRHSPAPPSAPHVEMAEAVPPAATPAAPSAAPPLAAVDAPRAEEERRYARRLVCAAVVTRLILLPLAAIPLNLCLLRLGCLPADEPMLMLVLHVMTGVPSSQTLVAVLIARGRPDLASFVSQVYVPQYLLSIFTIAVLIVIAIFLTSEGPS